MRPARSQEAACSRPSSGRSVHEPAADVHLPHVAVVAQVDEPLKVGLEAGGSGLSLGEDVVHARRR
eukprot:scaffold1763_cov91-Isochrysis_galbana.AAC.1